MLGPEIPAKARPEDPNAVPDESKTLTDGLRAELAGELENESQRVRGHTLAAIAQQYEDLPQFGASVLRATAEGFYRSGVNSPSSVHKKLAALPFPLRWVSA